MKKKTVDFWGTMLAFQGKAMIGRDRLMHCNTMIADRSLSICTSKVIK